MKRLLIMLCLMIVIIAGFSSCAYEAYPTGGYVEYGYAPHYYTHPWGGGYHRGYHHDYGRRGWGHEHGRGHYGRR